MKFALFILCLFFCIGGSLSSCEWCQQTKFQDQYLHKYYPKALVIVEDYFSTMCSNAIEQSLAEIVAMLADNPWRFFKNAAEKFVEGEYWENIIEQLTIIHFFLEAAEVNIVDGVVSTPDITYIHNGLMTCSNNFSDKMPFEWVPLTLHWTKEGKTTYYEFCALFCDYLVKMINEGIKFKQLVKAQDYLGRLEAIVEKLRNSNYANYQEQVTKSKELVALLRQNLGVCEIYDELDRILARPAAFMPAV